jgi:low affinity Fe/Cu permease
MHYHYPYAKSFFGSLASKTSHWMGHPIGFVVAVGVIAVWAMTGPMFHFSDTWQLVINTGTTIVTFLMVFLIQNTQNRDSRAIQIKLDELIRAARGAHNALLDLEELTDDELMKIREQYILLAQQARENLVKGLKDTGTVDLPGTADFKKSL